jgi:hypothetical protein
MATQTIGETIKTTIRRRDERVFQESLAGV